MINFLGQNIFKVLFTAGIVATLSACVTQQYKDDKTPIIANEANKSEIAVTRISLGLGYLKMGNTTQAKLNLEKAKRAAPNLPQVYTAFAHYYESVGEPEQAVLAYEKALSIKSDDADTLNNYGVFLCRQGQADKAETQLLRAIKVPSYLLVSQSYENIALCQLKSNNFEKAEKYLKKAIEHNPNNTSALINMAQLQYAKGDYKAAENTIKHFEKATRRFKPEALALAFKIYQKLGQRKAAKSYAAMLVKMYPQSYQAKQYLLNELTRTNLDVLAATYRKVMASKRFAMSPSNKKRVIKLSPKNNIGRSKVSLVKQTKSSEVEANKALVKKTAVKKTSNNTLLANKPTADLTSPANVIHALSVEPALPIAAVNATINSKNSTTTTAKKANTLNNEKNQQKAEKITAQIPTSTINEQVNEQRNEKNVAKDKVTTSKSELTNNTIKPRDKLQLDEDEITNLVNEATDVTVAEPDRQSKALGEDEIHTPIDNSNEKINVTSLAEQNNKALLSQHKTDTQKNLIATTDNTMNESKAVKPLAHSVSDAEIDQMISENIQEDNISIDVLINNDLQDDEVISNTQETSLNESEKVNPSENEISLDKSASDEKTSNDELYYNLEDLPAHTVKSGENLFRISRKYNIRIRTLRKWNNLTDKSVLRVGEVIYLADPNSVVTNK